MLPSHTLHNHPLPQEHVPMVVSQWEHSALASGLRSNDRLLAHRLAGIFWVEQHPLASPGSWHTTFVHTLHVCFILPMMLFRKGEGTVKLCPTINFSEQMWHRSTFFISACSFAGRFCGSIAGRPGPAAAASDIGSASGAVPQWVL